MASHIFPLNLLKLQRPPVLRLRTRGDGALTIRPFDAKSPVGSGTDTGQSTETQSGTMHGTETYTNQETGTEADVSTQTATALVVPGGEKIQQVISTTVRNVRMGAASDPSNLGFAVDPKQLESVTDERGNPVDDVSNVQISRVHFRERPLPGAAATDITINPTGPVPGAGLGRLFPMNDSDAVAADDTDNIPDVDGVTDDDTDEDAPQDSDSVASEGVVVPMGGGTFRPPLAPRGTRAKRRK